MAFLKRTIVKTMRKTEIGNNFLDNIIQKRRLFKGIREYAEELKDETGYCIYGLNTLSRKIADELKKEIGHEPTFYILKKRDGASEKEGENIISLSEAIIRYDDLKVLVCPSRFAVKDIEDLLDAGYEWKDLVLGTVWESSIGGKAFDTYDAMLGYTRVGDDGIPGFTVFQNAEDTSDCITIATLGGSTTDPTTSNIKSWPEYLFNRISQMGIPVRIYCGGISSYFSGQETLKLIKDVLPIMPDIVISYSGINDNDFCQSGYGVKKHPYFTSYHERFMKFALDMANKEGYFRGVPIHEGVNKLTLGIPNEKSAPEKWVDNERIIHAICQEFGISFYAFLQPCRDYGNYINTGENGKKTYEENLQENIEKVTQWYKSAQEKIKDLDYITDLTSLFDGKKNIYYDYCHVFEKGNQLIASRILKSVLPEIRDRMKRSK